MKPNEVIQKEDNPVVAEPAKIENTIKEEGKQAKGFWTKLLPWAVCAVICLIVGASLVFFALYQPKTTKLQTDLSTAQAQFDQTSKKLASAETDLAIAKTDLETAQASVVALTSDLAKSNQVGLIHKFQADVNAARAALLKLDPASARQALNFVKTDLAELEKTNLDTNALSGFKTLIEEADANLGTDPLKSLDALDTLYTNLLLLISNL
jgi:ribosomal protein S20